METFTQITNTVEIITAIRIIATVLILRRVDDWFSNDDENKALEFWYRTRRLVTDKNYVDEELIKVMQRVEAYYNTRFHITCFSMSLTFYCLLSPDREIAAVGLAVQLFVVVCNYVADDILTTGRWVYVLDKKDPKELAAEYRRVKSLSYAASAART